MTPLNPRIKRGRSKPIEGAEVVEVPEVEEEVEEDLGAAEDVVEVGVSRRFIAKLDHTVQIRKRLLSTRAWVHKCTMRANLS